MAHFPPNPISKPGYRLEFHDEFEQGRPSSGLWLPWYLPHWSSRESARAHTSSDGEHLVLRIDEDQQPWCPEFDGNVRASSLQTGVRSGPPGSREGQHRFSAECVVREAQETTFICTPQYGYVETRMLGPTGAGNHAALWMIGTEDKPEHCAEICVCELFGAERGARSSAVRFGVHPFHDPGIKDDFHTSALPIDTAEFHLYAADWTPAFIDFFVDNQHTGRVLQSLRYPMQLMLSLYELPEHTLASHPYPKTCMVDYVRVYQPAQGYEVDRP
jgi:hypothetical protein